MWRAQDHKQDHPKCLNGYNGEINEFSLFTVLVSAQLHRGSAEEFQHCWHFAAGHILLHLLHYTFARFNDQHEGSARHISP